MQEQQNQQINSEASRAGLNLDKKKVLFDKLKKLPKRTFYLAFMILLILTPLLVFVIQRVYFISSSKYDLYKHQEDLKKTKQQLDKEYQQLLDKQAKSKIKSDDSNLYKKREAQGNFDLNIILVKPADLADAKINSLVNKIKLDKDEVFDDCQISSTCIKNSSFFYINTFLKGQAKKYGIDNFNLELKFYGPLVLSNLSKVGDVAYIWEKDAFGTIKLQDDFNKLLDEHNIKLSSRSLVIFLYFDDTFDSRGASDKERFYEHKKFRSFADENTGKAFINVYDFSPSFSISLTEIVSHELLHLFGASDKYEESESVKRICKESGRGDLEKQPPLPQTTTDLMCMYIEEVGDQFKRASFSDGTLVVNSYTAKEIGWKK